MEQNVTKNVSPRSHNSEIKVARRGGGKSRDKGYRRTYVLCGMEETKNMGGSASK